MSLFENWLETFKGVLTGPTEFFQEEGRNDGFGYPLKFALISLGLAAVINGVRAGVFGTAADLMGGAFPAGGVAAMALGTVAYTFIVGVIGLFLGAAIVHLFVHLLGGENSYGQTLSVFEYVTALSVVTSLVAFIPLLGGLVNLALLFYGIYIQVRGLESYQGLSTGRALASIALPYVVLFALAITLMVMAVGAGVMAAMV